MTSKTLTDPDGDTIVIGGRTPDDVYVSITQGAALAVVRGIPADDLLAAIREVTGTPEPESMTTVQSLRATIAQLYSDLVNRDRQIKRLEAAKPKPEPAPSTPPTAEDFARARFAEVDGGAATRWSAGDDVLWENATRFFSDSNMADLARGGRARIIREAPTDAAALIDLAWEAAHVAPEGVRVPPHTPCVERSDDGRSTFAPDGFSFDADAHGTGWEIRTFAPLPVPRPEGAERIEAILREDSEDGETVSFSALADRIAREVGA